jgi:propanediol dehydratase large subunit
VTEGEFKASVVGAYERGERAISVQRLVRMAEIYSMNPADLLPATGTQGIGHVIDLDQISAGDGDISERFIAAIHLLRSAPGSREIRAADRVVLSSLLEVDSQKVTNGS